MIYWELFLVFLKVGAFGFGGGYAVLPLIESEIVDANHWLTTQEFTDLITISQMTPGPIAINSATFVGTRVAGVGGALAATLGSVFPSIIIVTTIATIYFKYRNLDALQAVLTSLRPAVVALIATAGLTMIVTSFWGSEVIGISTTNFISVFIFIISLFLLLKSNWDPIIIMVLAGVMNVLSAMIMNMASV